MFPAIVHAGAWFTPTLVSWRGHRMIGSPDLKIWFGTLSGVAEAWPALQQHWIDASDFGPTDFERKLFGQFGELTAAASRAGVRLLAGTDLGDPYIIPGYALHDELELMVKAGVPTLTVLQSATSETPPCVWAYLDSWVTDGWSCS